MFKLKSSRYLPEPVDPHAFNTNPPERNNAPIGIILINLGTPDQPDAVSIRRYLKEFLSDPRVIELPALLWQPILRLFVLTRRPRVLAPRYKSIWLDEGSPLLVYSQAQADGVQNKLQEQGINAKVVLGMRYGNPSIASAMQELQQQGCERILALPLYPQYAASTTATAVDKLNEYLAVRRDQPEMRYVKRYSSHQGYISALAKKVQDFWAVNGLPEYLLLSYHGLPRVSIEQGDAYYRDCMETTSQLAQYLGAEGHRVKFSFQSRFGAQQWLEPYTEPTLREWARNGVKRVDVMCPGFLADCLETLEEIQIECHDAFIEEGGQTLNYIACLNADQHWIDELAVIAQQNLSGWIET